MITHDTMGQAIHPFYWVNKKEGDLIEGFLFDLCLTLPSVAKEILAIGFSDLRSWWDESGPLDDKKSIWQVAPCGCLIGSSAVCAVKKIPGLVPILKNEEPPELKAFEVLYLARCYATGAKPKYNKNGSLSRSDPVLRDFVRVGLAVSRASERFQDAQNKGIEHIWQEYTESDSAQESLGQYLLEYIRSMLTLMGHTRLPKSPEQAVRES